MTADQRKPGAKLPNYYTFRFDVRWTPEARKPPRLFRPPHLRELNKLAAD